MTSLIEAGEGAALPPTDEPVVCADHVWKLHQLGDEVVKALVDATLTVLPGEFACLMGPSGSGKSTLLNMIGGLDRPTKGTVFIDGTDTATLSESQFAALRHDTVGFIFQSYNLIPFLSAVENVSPSSMFIARRSGASSISCGRGPAPSGSRPVMVIAPKVHAGPGSILNAAALSLPSMPM